MYNGINLLNFPDSSKSKYIISLMEFLFTEEERNNGITLLPNGKTSSKRQLLDKERMEHLKSK